MNKKYIAIYESLAIKLEEYSREVELLGLDHPSKLDCFIMQCIDSIKRIEYVQLIKDKEFDGTVINSQSRGFDPIKGAAYYIRNNNIDEAFWLTFLAIHFGKNAETEWKLCKAFYGGLNEEQYWTWNRISNHIEEFEPWLELNYDVLSTSGKFGNHRKYQSIKPDSKYGIHSTFRSYCEIIGDSHTNFITRIENERKPNQSLFNVLYKELNKVIGFNRMGAFDLAAMICKLGLVKAEPDSTYLTGATGPITGAKLLFYGRSKIKKTPKELEQKLDALTNYLSLDFGMQVMEDAICNWQKDPMNYTKFRG